MFATPCCTAGAVTSGAFTSTTIGTGDPGNAFSTRSNVFTIGIEGGKSVMLGNFVFRPVRAGIESAKSAPAESATEIAGRLITAGRTESEPMIATATTIIVPIPIDLNVGSPTTIIPATAISTVTPEIRTAWPEVRAVR